MPRGLQRRECIQIILNRFGQNLPSMVRISVRAFRNLANALLRPIAA